MNGAFNISTPNLTNFFQPRSSPPQRLSQSSLSINHEQPSMSEQYSQPPRAANKQQIALAIKSGHSPYEMYGLQDANEEDDWC